VVVVLVVLVVGPDDVLVVVVVGGVGEICASIRAIALSIFCNATVRSSQLCIPVPARFGPIYFTSSEETNLQWSPLQPHGPRDPHPGQLVLNGIVYGMYMM
jgi:hypothetical protein